MLLSWYQNALSGAGGSEVQLFTRVATCAVAFGFLHGFFRLAASRCRSVEVSLRNDWSNRAIASLHALIVGAPSAIALAREVPFRGVTAGLLRLEPKVDALIGDSETLHWLLPVSLGYFLYDCFAMAFDTSLSSFLFVVHHLMSLIVWPVSFLSHRGHYYVLALMASEISTPALHTVAFYMPTHGLRDKPFYVPLGICMILLFFLARVLPIPFTLYSMSATWGFWREPEDRMIFLMWAVSVPVPPLMNGYWFCQLVVGALKAIGVMADDSKKPKDN